MKHVVRRHRRELGVLPRQVDRGGGILHLRIDLAREQIGGRELVARIAGRRRVLELGVGEAVVEAALVVGDLQPRLVEIGERLVFVLVGRADHQQLAVAHIRLGECRRARPLERAAHAGHRHVELVGGKIAEHRAERHLDVFDPDAERRPSVSERIHVEAVKPAGRVPHAEHRRVHGGADAQHAALSAPDPAGRTSTRAPDALQPDLAEKNAGAEIGVQHLGAAVRRSPRWCSGRSCRRACRT